MAGTRIADATPTSRAHTTSRIHHAPSVRHKQRRTKRKHKRSAHPARRAPSPVKAKQSPKPARPSGTAPSSPKPVPPSTTAPVNPGNGLDPIEPPGTVTTIAPTQPWGAPTPVSPPSAANGSSPLAGIRWYVSPYTTAASQQAALQSSDPASAVELDKIASQPMAAWFPNSDPNVTEAVTTRINLATAQHAVAQLVAYNIPDRDCGGWSSGGAASASAYETWIDEFAAGIGSHQAVVILEPDALAGLSCLSPSDQITRLALIRYAVSTLAAHSGVHLYIDAGNEGWQTPVVMAARLEQADIAQAAGFSLNVDNFYSTSSEEAYGRSISDLVLGKHFVIDTSRNGNGSDGQWCNPVGRALGQDPTTSTGDALTDALLWIKTPGVSDGSCNGGPVAGTWWPAYALQLAQNATS
jgi:endoglucanase